MFFSTSGATLSGDGSGRGVISRSFFVIFKGAWGLILLAKLNTLRGSRTAGYEVSDVAELAVLNNKGPTESQTLVPIRRINTHGPQTKELIGSKILNSEFKTTPSLRKGER